MTGRNGRVAEYWSFGGTRIIAGAGALFRLRQVVDELGGGPVLLITSPSLVREGSILEHVREQLGPRLAELWPGARRHVPWSTVERAHALARHHRARLVIGLGGGSTIDTIKGLVWYAAQQDPPWPLRHVAIPSTLGGADLTPFAGVTRGAVKTPVRGAGLAPAATLLDPAVLATAPAALLCVSVANAIAHCVEGLVSIGATPVSDACYSHGLRLLGSSTSGELESRDPCTLARLQQGASLAALAPVPMGLAHALVHLIAACLEVDHGVAHGVVAVPVMRFNAPSVARRQRAIAASLGRATDGLTDDQAAAVAADATAAVMRRLGLPAGLAELSVERAQLTPLAARAVADPALSNPRPIADPAALEPLLDAIWAGEAR